MKKLKQNHLKLLLVLFFIFLFNIYNFYIANIFTTENFNYLLYWLLILIVLKSLVGIPKDRHLYKADIMQIVFIYSVILMILTYLLGLLVGFNRNLYNLSFLRIMANIIPATLIIFFQELVRYIFIVKSEPHKFIAHLLILGLILGDIMIKLPIIIPHEIHDIFELIILLIIPTFGKHYLLSYIVLKSGIKPSILYRFIFDLPIYFLPIFPDLGSYLESIIFILLPMFLFLRLNTFLARVKPQHLKRGRINKIIFWLPTLGFLLVIVTLISGLFKVYGIAVASSSMAPNIDRGDTIIVEKLNNEEIKALKVGDIITYEYDQRLIVHRIVEIINKNNSYIFKTKGDNNENVDNYEIEKNRIRGVVKLRIKYIGYPAVWLSEVIG